MRFHRLLSVASKEHHPVIVLHCPLWPVRKRMPCSMQRGHCIRSVDPFDLELLQEPHVTAVEIPDVGDPVTTHAETFDPQAKRKT